MARMKHVKMSGGTETVGSRVAHPIVYPSIALRPKGELIAPVLSFAIVATNPVVLECSEELDTDFVPATTDFDVQKNAGSAAITSVAVVGTTVKLTMTVAIVQGDTLTVAYTKPTANTRLRDLRGNEVASFTAQTVLNYTPGAADTTVPRFSFAIVNTTTIRMIYDEQLDTGSVPATTAFSVSVNGGGGVNPSAVAINGDTVSLTITAVISTDTVTVAYTAPGANMLQDLAGNDAASLGAQTCINVTDVTVGGTPSTQDFGDAPTTGTGPPPAGTHGHGMPSASASYDAIITAASVISGWDDFTGRLATVASSERYSTSVSGAASTPIFAADATTGQTFMRVGSGVLNQGDANAFRFNSTFTPRAAEDYGFKVILNEGDPDPFTGAGLLNAAFFYQVGLLESLAAEANEANLTDGIYLRLRYATDGAGTQSKGNWLMVCRNANTETTRDLGVSASTTRQLLEFRITGDGTSVQAYVNNVATGAAITTNIPTNLLIPAAKTVRTSDGGAGGNNTASISLWGWGLRSGL